MGDTFSFGEPARHPRRAATVDTTKIAVAVLVLAVVAAGVIGLLSVFREGGEVAAASARQAVSQIALAQDIQAQSSLLQVATAAQIEIARSETGSPDAASADGLAQTEPRFTYTTGPSTAPDVVSVAVSTTTWSAAVASTSGTCHWIRIDVEQRRTFGSGTPCTGAAAVAAADPSW